MEWFIIILFIIAIGFICIACPVLLLTSLPWLPWYVIVAFFIWLVSCIGIIAFSKGKYKECNERMIPAVILTAILTFFFTVLILISIDTDRLFDENKGMFLVLPTSSLPAFYFVGIWLNKKWQAKQEEKRQESNKSIDKLIANKVVELQRLEQSVKEKTMVIHLVDMLGYCGEDVLDIASDPRVCNITKITSDIKKIQDEIQHLQEKKR